MKHEKTLEEIFRQRSVANRSCHISIILRFLRNHKCHEKTVMEKLQPQSGEATVDTGTADN